MKRGRLPLTALRSFEAAGRHESFTRAAAELFVSQAAVSRQVRELERSLGHTLFERRHRQVVITERGRFLLDLLTASFDDIDRGLEEMRASPAETILSVSVEPSFAACWLVPRLHRFRMQHPDIDVAVDADPRPTDFRSSKCELAIRWSEKITSWPHVQAERLADVAVSPFLSPALLASGQPLLAPLDLRCYTLLHEEDRSWWTRWFHAAGVLKVPAVRGPLFADTALAMQAAVLGHGVALSNMLLAEADMRAGNLVKPFDVEVPCGTYWLVAPDLAKLSKAAFALLMWLRQEVSDKTARAF